MVLGPKWGGIVADRLGLGTLFTASWFYLRWVLALLCAVLGIELVYYLAPNVEQRNFLRTVPGAVVAVVTWIIASYGFGLYLQHFGQFSKSYGTLAAVAALLLWLYLSSAAVLIGAQVNVEILKATREQLPVKEVPNAPNQHDASPIRLVS
jgi:membrane protein